MPLIIRRTGWSCSTVDLFLESHFDFFRLCFVLPTLCCWKSLNYNFCCNWGECHASKNLLPILDVSLVKDVCSHLSMTSPSYVALKSWNRILLKYYDFQTVEMLWSPSAFLIFLFSEAVSTSSNVKKIILFNNKWSVYSFMDIH